MAAVGLDAAHERVRVAAASGVPADFSKPHDPDELPAYENEEHWAGRTVDGEWLADFLVDDDQPKHRRGVDIVGARVRGGLDLDWATVDFPLRLAASQLGTHRISLQDANLRSLRLPGSRCGGLVGEGVRITGELSLQKGFAAIGEVWLRGASIRGNLACDRGAFMNTEGVALILDRAQITGSVFLRSGFAATGEVRLLGASIGRTLDCDGGTFTNPGDDALSLDSATITGGVFLRNGFVATGGVRFPGATIGVLACDGGTFTNPGRVALTLDGAKIIGSTWMRNGFAATGEVRLLGATIGSTLDCDGGTFTNPGGHALSLDRAQITGGVLLRSGFAATGQVRLAGATIGANFECDAESTFTSPVDHALFLDFARITGGVFLREEARVNGSISLVSASAGALADDRESWPPRLGLEGFTYGRLYSPDDGWKARREWLRRQLRPSPLAYLQLAAVYRAGGDERSARKILMERHNARLRPPEHWKDQLPKGTWGWARRAGRWFLRLTIGHGYEPWRVVCFAVPLLLAMTLWYGDAKRHDVLVPARATGAVASHCDDQQVCVQPFVYALDTLVPLVELRQRSEWMPDQSRRDGTWYRDGRWLAAATWLTSLLGWVFATLVAASFTQVVRRE